MAKSKVLKHVIPHIGKREIVLYPPSDVVYDRLWAEKEIRRLNKLRHLGALSHAFPGARHARWDYTLAMLHYCDELRVPGMNSKFTIGRIEFSSAIAALQSISLLWNVGHLPGTFSVEKGVYQFLHSVYPEDPTEGLPWSGNGDEAVDILKSNAASLLRSEDYSGLSRVLAVVKILNFSTGVDDFLYSMLEDFVGPFFLEIRSHQSTQWPKLRRAFSLVRHLAYLTLDASYTGLRWSPNVPALLQQTLTTGSDDLHRIASRISEILSPLERSTYELIYHSPDARRECALIAGHVYNRLSEVPDLASEIHRWMGCGLFRELRLGRRISPSKLKRVAGIRLRSHFALPSDSPVEIEEHLRNKGFTHPTVFEYKAWNSDVLLEPDEIIVDAITKGSCSANHIGRLLLWIITKIDDLDSLLDEPFSMLVKNDVERSYLSLLSRAIQINFRGIDVQLEPWRLQDFGLFPDVGIADDKGAIWAASPRLDDPITRYILRDRSRSIHASLRDKYAELMGLRELRLRLRRDWARKKELRQRFLIVTASVRFCDDERRLIEFDGGLVKISTRSGRMTWYGLESKRGRSSPLQSLRRRIRVLGLDGATYPLTNRHAVLEMSL
jgi:hypothetical protein